MTIYEQLGMRITYLRKQKKMSQLALSIEAEINKNYLSDLEKGRRNPTLLILNKIATALNCDLSYLLQGVKDFSLEDLEYKMSSIR
ncbi:MAG: helix-turn-helix domain-containing protein [Bacilli bacterium]